MYDIEASETREAGAIRYHNGTACGLPVIEPGAGIRLDSFLRTCSVSDLLCAAAKSLSDPRQWIQHDSRSTRDDQLDTHDLRNDNARPAKRERNRPAGGIADSSYANLLTPPLLDTHILTPLLEKIPNSGNYTWTPPLSITRGNDYALEIINDALPDQTNYSPYFVIDSSNDVATQTPAYTYGAPPTGSSGEQHLTPTSTVSPTGTLQISQATPVTTVSQGDATGAAIASGLSMTSHTSGGSTSSGSAAAMSSNRAGAGAVAVGVKRLVALGAGVAVLF